MCGPGACAGGASRSAAALSDRRFERCRFVWRSRCAFRASWHGPVDTRLGRRKTLAGEPLEAASAIRRNARGALGLQLSLSCSSKACCRFATEHDWRYILRQNYCSGGPPAVTSFLVISSTQPIALYKETDDASSTLWPLLVGDGTILSPPRLPAQGARPRSRRANRSGTLVGQLLLSRSRAIPED